MTKVIIKNEADISDEEAMKYVYCVIEEGKVSETNGIKHYCWVTSFSDTIVVSTRKKKNSNSPESFVIYKK